MDYNPVLRQYFLNLLVKKDYSSFQLQQKAKQKGYSDLEIEAEIEWLKSKKFLDEKRLVENILLFYQGQKGLIWIKQKLQTLKISNDLIEETLTELDLDFSPSQSLKKQIENKYHFSFQSWQKLDFKIKSKVYRFLASRGFTDFFE